MKRKRVPIERYSDWTSDDVRKWREEMGYGRMQACRALGLAFPSLVKYESQGCVPRIVVYAMRYLKDGADRASR